MRQLLTGFIIVLAGAFSSCSKDWLDVKANKTQTVPSTLKDFQAILDNYASNNVEYLSVGEIASDGHYAPEAAWVSVSDYARNAYTWSYSKPYSALYWGNTYNRVFQANVVLDGLKNNAASVDQTAWNNVRGQALYHRADAFYRAAQVWAPAYNGTNDAASGIPLRLEADVVLPSVRSTLKQTYDQIIGDVQEAISLLPETPLYITRPSKPAAFALLSRVYLSMNNYVLAGAFADSSLRRTNKLLNFSTLATNLNFIGDTRTNPEVLLYPVMNTSSISNFLTTNCFISPDLYALYATNDLRKSIFFKVNANGSITYKGNYNNSASSLFCGPASDEMYLIRAEGYARSGKVTDALKDLNDLLRTRWKKAADGSTTYVDQTAADAAAVLSLVLTERRKELLLRGLRWTDLRRLNNDDRFKVTLSRTIGGQTFTLEPGHYNYTFPIPDDIIQRTGMPQNPGWVK